MSNWFTRMLRLNSFFGARAIETSRVGQSGLAKVINVIEDKEPCESLSKDEIIALVREREINGYILINDKLYRNVDLHIKDDTPGVRVLKVDYGLIWYPEDYYINVFEGFRVISVENYPATETDVKSPGDWVVHIPDCIKITNLMDNILQTTQVTLPVLQKDDIRFIQVNASLYPLIKLYDDNSWVTVGWEGPAIVFMLNDNMFNKAYGVIPDNLEVRPLSEVYENILAFVDGPLLTMNPEQHACVIDFEKKYQALIEFFDKNNIPYKKVTDHE